VGVGVGVGVGVDDMCRWRVCLAQRNEQGNVKISKRREKRICDWDRWRGKGGRGKGRGKFKKKKRKNKVRDYSTSS